MLTSRFDLETKETWWYPEGWTRQHHLPPTGKQKIWLNQQIENWSVMVDGGAFVGGWTQYWAPKFGKVYAIELAPDTAEALEKNTEDWDNVVVVNAALADEPGRYVGFEGDKDPNSPVRCVVGQPNADYRGWLVSTLALDDLPLADCGFIKLDLQGYDLKALMGAKKTITKYHPLLLFEWDQSCYERYGHTREDANDFLNALDYKQIGRFGKDLVYKYDMA